MNNESSKKYRALGQELKACREAKSIELSALAGRTKINVSFLKKIEDGELDFLPQTYVRAFLRAYAKEVGLDPEAVLAQYEESLFKNDKIAGASSRDIYKGMSTMPDDQTPQKAERHAEFGNRKWADLSPILKSKLAFILIAAFVFIFLALLILPRIGKKSDVNADIEIAEIPLEAGINLEDSTFAPTQEAPQGETFRMPLRLTITASETTWMRITLDDSVSDECIFTPGDVRTWESDSTFRVFLGNAGGVNLSLNGRSLGVPGSSGQVDQVIVTKAGMEKLSPPSSSAGRNTNDLTKRE